MMFEQNEWILLYFGLSNLIMYHDLNNKKDFGNCDSYTS